MDNQAVLKKQLNKQKHQPVKMPAIEKFNGEWLKLKRFLTQIKIRIDNERPKLTTPFNKIIYARIHLIRKPFKWFQFYLSETQTNGVIIINKEVRYIFLLWKGFKSQLVQMYRDFEEEKIATKKLYKLKQMALAMVYMTEFQSLSI